MAKYKVAVIGAGPAGIYASDILSHSDVDVAIDLLEKLPAPYGLVRYGVAPDHPRIRTITQALYNVLKRGDIRFIGNVEVGKDLNIDELWDYYDAIVIATGANDDRPLNIPGADLPEVYGASAFVSWYDAHPDYPREWPLTATDVAVIGAGNVALDISRMLAKAPDALMSTDIPTNVERGLRAAATSSVHLFARRGPAQAKFTPQELRELARTDSIDVRVEEEGFDFDEASQAELNADRLKRQVVEYLQQWLFQEEDDHTGDRTLTMHFLQRPVEILGSEHVEGIRMERTELQGDGSVKGTGQFVDYPVQAVYAAVGYASSALPGAPFDEHRHVIPHHEGRVIGVDGATMTGLYATGWIKRGPVGLIGSTKSDAAETIGHLVEDLKGGILHQPAQRAVDILSVLDQRSVRFTTWDGWEKVTQWEYQLGEQLGRGRVKEQDAETMTAISRGERQI
ncbi:MAG: FAD-dependent oxidoreductase [Actinomycetaceae bacterium]|nr:FAD-dependent oxidoreductase [Actinomycetaceae bacterium]MDY6082811.1 FAD-dependent oxidoreductase [Actinomycetaceae bacterium]